MNQQFSRPWSWKWNHERKTETFGFLLRESFKRDEACYCLGLWSTMTQILWCGQISAQNGKVIRISACLSVCLSLGWSILELDVSFGGWLHQIKSHGTQKKRNANIWRCLVADSSHTKWFQETWECNKLGSQSVVAANRNDERTGWRRVSDWLLQMLHY